MHLIVGEDANEPHDHDACSFLRDFVLRAPAGLGRHDSNRAGGRNFQQETRLMNRLTTFMMAFALLMLMGKAQATILASARGDYADGINAGDLAILGATGSGTWTYLSSDTANPSLDGDGLPIMAWDPLASNGGVAQPG